MRQEELKPVEPVSPPADLQEQLYRSESERLALAFKYAKLKLQASRSPVGS